MQGLFDHPGDRNRVFDDVIRRLRTSAPPTPPKPSRVISVNHKGEILASYSVREEVAQFAAMMEARMSLIEFENWKSGYWRVFFEEAVANLTEAFRVGVKDGDERTLPERRADFSGEIVDAANRLMMAIGSRYGA